MKRKLVKQGNNALTLSLPYKWIEKYELSKGDYIDVVEYGKDLLLSTSNIKKNKKYSIVISDKEPFYKRYLKSCYNLGYDEVEILSESKMPYNLIKESLSTLIGYELISQTKNKCVVGVISQLSNEKVDAIIKKLFFIIQTMFDDLIELITLKKYDEVKDVSEFESSINSYVNFCLRVLNKQGHEDFAKTQYYYNILILVEEISDSLKDYALSFSEKGKLTLEDLKLLREYFIEITKLYLKYEMGKISSVKQMRVDLYSKIRKDCSNSPLQYLDLYSILNFLHQFEVVIDPIKN